jgi:hypothetical protein
MGSFIVEFWSRVFYLPRHITPFWWVTHVFSSLEDSYKFVDAWVLGRFFGAILLYLATAPPSLRWLQSIAVLCGALMVIEALFYEADVLVFSGYRLAKEGRRQTVVSHRRLVITSLQNYAAIIVWFALFYRYWRYLYTVKPFYAHDQILTWLALSFKTMTGFGHVSVEVETVWAGGLLLAQAAIGVSMALLIVVSFVRLLPKPGTRDYWESSTLSDDEQTLVELVKMRKDGNMSDKDQSKDPFDMLCWVLAASVAARLPKAIETDKPTDRAKPYALAAILGSLFIGALCLGFAYQLFFGSTGLTVRGYGPTAGWAAPNVCPGMLFFVLGVALVGMGVGLAVHRAESGET